MINTIMMEMHTNAVNNGCIKFESSFPLHLKVVFDPSAIVDVSNTVTNNLDTRLEFDSVFIVRFSFSK